MLTLVFYKLYYKLYGRVGHFCASMSYYTFPPHALDVSRKKLEASLYKRSLETSEGRKVPPLLRSEVLPSYKILTIRFPGNPY